MTLEKQIVKYQNLGLVGYKAAWDLQELLLSENLELKTLARNAQQVNPFSVSTTHHLLFCEHNPVYTLGKSGDFSNVLLNEEELLKRKIEFFRTNRGGDITFHGPGQVVGYPIFDLEKFTTDIGVYLRNIEEVVIKVLSLYGIKGYRSKGETGVWLDPDIKGKERKICAIGVRCSRWITMHGFALNVNTRMDYFSNIVPCGILNKQVTSLSQELGEPQNMELVKTQLKKAFKDVFQINILD